MESEQLKKGKNLVVEMLQLEAAKQSRGLPPDTIIWAERDDKIILGFQAGLETTQLVAFFQDELEAVTYPGATLRTLLEQRIKGCLDKLPRSWEKRP